MTESLNNYLVPMNESKWSVCKIFVLDKNTWYHLTVSKEVKKTLTKM